MWNEPKIQQASAISGQKPSRPWSELPTQEGKESMEPSCKTLSLKQTRSIRRIIEKFQINDPCKRTRATNNVLGIGSDFVVFFIFLLILFADDKMGISRITEFTENFPL